MDRCKNCGIFLFSHSKAHSCKAFNVVDEDGEDWTIWATTGYGAAESFAKKYNEDGDYALMDGTMDILVDGVAYRVGAETDIHYSINEL